MDKDGVRVHLPRSMKFHWFLIPLLTAVAVAQPNEIRKSLARINNTAQ